MTFFPFIPLFRGYTSHRQPPSQCSAAARAVRRAGRLGHPLPSLAQHRRAPSSKGLWAARHSRKRRCRGTRRTWGQVKSMESLLGHFASPLRTSGVRNTRKGRWFFSGGSTRSLTRQLLFLGHWQTHEPTWVCFPPGLTTGAPLLHSLLRR